MTSTQEFDPSEVSYTVTAKIAAKQLTDLRAHEPFELQVIVEPESGYSAASPLAEQLFYILVLCQNAVVKPEKLQPVKLTNGSGKTTFTLTPNENNISAIEVVVYSSENKFKGIVSLRDIDYIPQPH